MMHNIYILLNSLYSFSMTDILRFSPNFIGRSIFNRVGDIVTYTIVRRLSIYKPDKSLAVVLCKIFYWKILYHNILYRMRVW